MSTIEPPSPPLPIPGGSTPDPNHPKSIREWWTVSLGPTHRVVIIAVLAALALLGSGLIVSAASGGVDKNSPGYTNGYSVGETIAEEGMALSHDDAARMCSEILSLDIVEGNPHDDSFVRNYHAGCADGFDDAAVPGLD